MRGGGLGFFFFWSGGVFAPWSLGISFLVLAVELDLDLASVAEGEDGVGGANATYLSGVLSSWRLAVCRFDISMDDVSSFRQHTVYKVCDCFCSDGRRTGVELFACLGQRRGFPSAAEMLLRAVTCHLPRIHLLHTCPRPWPWEGICCTYVGRISPVHHWCDDVIRIPQTRRPKRPVPSQGLEEPCALRLPWSYKDLSPCNLWAALFIRIPQPVSETPDMSPPLDVLVVGAGLSGLAASVQCALSGHRVTVLESAKELAEVPNKHHHHRVEGMPSVDSC